jgi:hypothetical protein
MPPWKPLRRLGFVSLSESLTIEEQLGLSQEHFIDAYVGNREYFRIAP